MRSEWFNNVVFRTCLPATSVMEIMELGSTEEMEKIPLDGLGEVKD